MTAIRFPDVALLVTEYLRSELALRGDTATVGTRVDLPRDARFVVVQRIGGTRATLLSERALLRIQCWDVLAEEAHGLAMICRALIQDMRGQQLGDDDTHVYRCDELAGPADLPDEISDQPRYVFTAEVHVRGTALAPLGS